MKFYLASLALGITAFGGGAQAAPPTKVLDRVLLMNMDDKASMSVVWSGGHLKEPRIYPIPHSNDMSRHETNVYRHDDGTYSFCNEILTDRCVGIDGGRTIWVPVNDSNSIKHKFRLELDESGKGYHLRSWRGTYLYKKYSNGSNIGQAKDKSEKTLFKFFYQSPIEVNPELLPTEMTQDNIFEYALLDEIPKDFLFHETFASPPAVFTQTQSHAEEDTVETKLHAVTKTHFTVSLQEENTWDTDGTHAAETVGYMAFGIGPIVDMAGNVIGEAKKIPVGQGEDQGEFVFDQTYSTTPIVISHLAPTTVTTPMHSRVTGVDSTRATLLLEVWNDAGNSASTTEVLDTYVVAIQPGEHVMPDGRILYADLVSGIDNSEVVHVFPPIYAETPVVLAASQTYVGNDPFTTRVWDVFPTGFNMKLVEAEWSRNTNDRGFHFKEQVGILALAQGALLPEEPTARRNLRG